MSDRAPGVKVLQMLATRGRMLGPIGSGWRGMSEISSRRGGGREAGYWGLREVEGTPQGAGGGPRRLERARVKRVGERAVGKSRRVRGAVFGGWEVVAILLLLGGVGYEY